jgi:hypothetical protein
VGSSPRYRTTLAISAFGVKVGVRVNEADAFGKLVPYLPVGWKPSSTESVGCVYSIELDGVNDRAPASHLLYRDRKKIFTCAEERLLLDTFESHITIHVADRARDRVFVHAGVVGWRGRAIVIPGRSFSGKTTLITELLRAGAVYYSDEYSVFDRQGRVHPYARPLHIRENGDSGQTKHAAEKLGARVGRKPLPLGLIVATRYRAGAYWRPRQISAGLGVLELLKNTVSARRAPEAALTSFQSAVAGAKVLRGIRGDAAEVVARLLAETT